MVYKWNEVDLNMFLDVFDSFWNGEDWSLDLILEIQNIPAIISNYPLFRFYLGKKINIYDFKEDNEQTINFMESAKDILRENNLNSNELDNITSLSMSILDEKRVRVVPISASSYDIMRSCFGLHIKGGSSLLSYMSELMNLWYIKKNDGQRIIDLAKGASKNYSDNEKYIRMRTMNFEDWKTMVDRYKITGKLDNIENDLNKSDFLII